MAILLTFTKSSGEQASTGPFASVRFEGERIVDVESGQAVAAHFGHGWSLGGESYLRLDVSGPVSVSWKGHADDPSTTGHFSCVNGVAYIDRRILAFVDRERNDWYVLREGHHQPALTLRLV
jgi:hypothetical protein